MNIIKSLLQTLSLASVIYVLNLIFSIEIAIISCLFVIVPWHLGWPKPYPVVRPSDAIYWRD